MDKVRIIEVNLFEVSGMRDGKEMKLNKFSMYTTSDWHCPIMAHNELMEEHGDGNIFQNMPGPKCGMFTEEGKIIDDEWRCENYKGHFTYHLVDEKESGVPAKTFAKCGRLDVVDPNVLDLLLYRIKEV